MTKGSKGNGLAQTNELLQAMLGELGHIKGKLGELDGIKSELGLIKGKLGELDGIKSELGAIKSELSEHRQILREHGQILREHGESLREHSVRLGNIETSMRQIAEFVGKDRLEQDAAIQNLTRRVENLERKAA
ncbi:MAG: hypothetical protein HYT87_05800 [Nitrospirae bacterium]|nr:hypothetical protein [Nitrospirota bacterium]